MKYSFFSKGINREQVSLEEFQRKKYIVREKKTNTLMMPQKYFLKYVIKNSLALYLRFLVLIFPCSGASNDEDFIRMGRRNIRRFLDYGFFLFKLNFSCYNIELFVDFGFKKAINIAEFFSPPYNSVYCEHQKRLKNLKIIMSK